ncbi:hypothetical protein HPB50_029438 [Hyalomma asiaticum]|nr:hypothetical protein HPB50_029438 [Hyalomma asiaticum]
MMVFTSSYVFSDRAHPSKSSTASAMQGGGAATTWRYLDSCKLKRKLLQRFRYTEEGYCVKFRYSRPENGETARQFAGRLCGYFDQWQQLANTPKTYDTLRYDIVSEQFVGRCDDRLAVFIKERGCRSLDMLATTADQYIGAQGATNLARRREKKGNR